MSAAAWAGVDIGGTKTAVLLSTEPPAVCARVEFPTLPADGPQRALDLIVKGVRDLSQGAPLRGIGVSCGGPLDSAAGVIQAPPNLWTWVDVPITTMLEKEFGVPARLENDANAGAVAEHRFGAGRGARNMVFLTMGTGLGAGIIADGRLYRGACDAAGEIGHVRLTRTGPVGYHKAGSVEGWASGGGMGRIATRIYGREMSARDVAQAAAAGDDRAQKLIHVTGQYLGRALAILVDILNPERIVVGGLAMRLGDALLNPARSVMKREALAASAAVCQVVPAELDERIGDVAALCVAMGI